MKELLSYGLESLRHSQNCTMVAGYLAEPVFYGGVIFQRGFILKQIQKAGEPDIILACIDDRQARARAAGRDPLAGAFFDATTLPYTDQVALYDAMGTGDMGTIYRLIAAH